MHRPQNLGAFELPPPPKKKLDSLQLESVLVESANRTFLKYPTEADKKTAWDAFQQGVSQTSSRVSMCGLILGQYNLTILGRSLN